MNWPQDLSDKLVSNLYEDIAQILASTWGLEYPLGTTLFAFSLGTAGVILDKGVPTVLGSIGKKHLDESVINDILGYSMHVLWFGEHKFMKDVLKLDDSAIEKLEKIKALNPAFQMLFERFVEGKPLSEYENKRIQKYFDELWQVFKDEFGKENN